MNLDERNSRKVITDTIEEYNKNGKKTIVVFGDSWYPIIDGVISVSNNYNKQLTKYYNVVMCVPKHKGKTVTVPDYLVIGVKAVYFKSLNYSLGMPDNDKFFKQCMSKLKIDLTYFHTPFNMGKYAAKLAKKRDIPLVASFHSQYKQDFWKNSYSHLVTGIGMSAIMKTLNKANICITMNDYAKAVVQDYGYKGEILVLPHGTNHLPLQDDYDTTEIEKEIGVSHDDNVLLFVGRAVKVKNVDFLLESVNQANKTMDVKLVVVGGGPYLKSLKLHAKKLKLGDKVKFLGVVTGIDKMRALYKRADLFVFPSTYDTDGIVKIEAAAQKTPSLVIAKSGAAATITSNRNGYVCEQNIAKYAKKIVEILNNKKKLKEIGNRAQKEIYKTWENQGQRLHDIFEYVMDSSKK